MKGFKILARLSAFSEAKSSGCFFLGFVVSDLVFFCISLFKPPTHINIKSVKFEFIMCAIKNRYKCSLAMSKLHKSIKYMLKLTTNMHRLFLICLSIKKDI